jgi:hypothetical protein
MTHSLTRLTHHGSHDSSPREGLSGLCLDLELYEQQTRHAQLSFSVERKQLLSLPVVQVKVVMPNPAVDGILNWP